MYDGRVCVVYFERRVLISEMRRVAGIAGRPGITTRDFSKHSKIAVSGLYRRFGSWRGALEHAGLTSPREEEP